MEDSRMSAIAILYILKEYSDEAHPLSSNACIPLLEQVYDIKINRGTLSAYIKQLRNFKIFTMISALRLQQLVDELKAGAIAYEM